MAQSAAWGKSPLSLLSVNQAVLDKVFWQVCHYLAGKQQTSIPQILKQYSALSQQDGRQRRTLRVWVTGKATDLWVFPPKTQSIYRVGHGAPDVDQTSQISHEWARGRSREQQIEALEAANYQCQECGTPEHLAVHHVGGLRGYRTMKALVTAGRAKQRVVLCQSCHLRIGHGGSFRPVTQDHSVA